MLVLQIKTTTTIPIATMTNTNIGTRTKNIISDGVVDNQNVKTSQLALNLRIKTTTPQTNQNAQDVQNNQSFMRRSHIPKK